MRQCSQREMREVPLPQEAALLFHFKAIDTVQGIND